MADEVAKSERDRRLAEALKANLRRRKAQAKSRRSGAQDPRAGLAAGTDDAADSLARDDDAPPTKPPGGA
jgi:hypothetical protein